MQPARAIISENEQTSSLSEDITCTHPASRHDKYLRATVTRGLDELVSARGLRWKISTSVSMHC